MSHQGRAYQAPSGQWSWAIAEDGVDIQGGAGYTDEDEALEAMDIELASYQQWEREKHIRQMVANFQIEGIEPSAKDQALHQEYTVGEVTLDDLHNHAIAFALEQSAHEHSPSNSSRAQEMLAAGHWVTYYDDHLVPNVILREWPDGRMEIVDTDGKGNIFVVKELPAKEELRRRRDSMRSAVANGQLSGLYPTKEALAMMEGYATSTLTWDEFFKGTPLGPAT